jgi:hypothetical protein
VRFEAPGRAPRPAPCACTAPHALSRPAPSPPPPPPAPPAPPALFIPARFSPPTLAPTMIRLPACALRTVLWLYFPPDTLNQQPARLCARLSYRLRFTHTTHTPPPPPPPPPLLQRRPTCPQRLSLPRACPLLPRCSLRFAHVPFLTRFASHTLRTRSRSLAHLARFASQQRRAARTCARACSGQSSGRGRRRRTLIPRRARRWKNRPPCGRRTRTTSS